MSLTVYNVLTRTQEPFVPVHPGTVGMYVCGPTVYDHPHLGHAKTYVAFDVVNRYLRFLGYRVRYVQNITDVGHLLDTGEDRIQRGAQRDRLEPMEVAEKYTWSYFDEMDALGVRRPDISPRASGHIPEQIELIQRLLDRGFAYEVDGSVYFSVESYPKYGQLSRRNLEEMRAGVRVDPKEHKRNPLDFALWKRAEPSHLMQWPSPWGRGFPGWHIECTAMAAKYLGLPFDIHGGGVDNLFPHNESEIAQADAAFGTGYAKYWLLTGSLTVGGVKMSKSLGNFVTVSEARAKAHPAALRLLILNGHYRAPLSFSWEALEAASAGVRRLATASSHMERFLTSRNLPLEADLGSLQGSARDFAQRCQEAMDDDFNTPNALAALFELAHRAHQVLAHPTPAADEVRGLWAVWKVFGEQVLGIVPDQTSQPAVASKLVDLLLSVREELRAAKQFALADRIRADLMACGIVVEDTPEGVRWRWESP